MNLQGKTAIVTGGAVRLGRAIALALAEQGACVCLHYGNSEQEAQQTVARIHAAGVQATSIQADLREPADAARAIIAHAAACFGGVDILINNAAIFEPGSLETTSEDEWDRHFAINLKAPFFLCQAFAAALKPDQQGHIISLADWRALRPGKDYLAYTLSKSGLVTLTRSLARQLAPRVQVNAIAPGAILPAPGQDIEQLNQRARQIPLRRAGSPADISEAILFLLHSDFITGEVLPITGGEQL